MTAFLLFLSLGSTPDPLWVVPDPLPVVAKNQKAAPGVAAARTFRNASHNCPQCGRAQYVIAGFNSDGTHRHRCNFCGTVWFH